MYMQGVGNDTTFSFRKGTRNAYYYGRMFFLCCIDENKLLVDELVRMPAGAGREWGAG